MRRQHFIQERQEVGARLADGEGLDHGLLESLEVMLHVFHDHKDVIQLVSHHHLRSQGSGFTLIRIVGTSLDCESLDPVPPA